MDHFELGSCQADGAINELRVLGFGRGNPAVAMELNGNIYFPLHDHLGHVSCLLDHSGSIVETYRYTAFGEENIYDAEQQLQMSSLNPWRYAGKRHDPESGFIYFGLRYYNPATAVWITPDPIAQEGGPNLYAYVLNNPLAFFDQLGLSPEIDALHEYEADRIIEHFRNPNRVQEKKREDDRGIFGTIADMFRNPRVQGGLQVVGGFSEACIGGVLTLTISGVGAAAGVPIMMHGSDHFFTGVGAVISGRHQETATSQLLQKAGMSAQTAILVDSGLSIAGSMGGTAMVMRSSSTVANQGITVIRHETKSTSELLFHSWDRGTFPNRMKSIQYHFQKHGSERTMKEYTQDALHFFKTNQDKKMNVILKNGKKSYSIKINQNSQKAGGFWTEDEKIVTYWD